MNYLDNAATTFPKPECVYTAADSFYRSSGANAERGQSPLARQAAKMIADTRQKLAAWLSAPASEQVIFTPAATIALNYAILGTPLRYGDVVYVTPFEHNSVLRPVEHLRQTRSIIVREIPVQPGTYAVQFDRLKAQFRAEPPEMVIITQASNVCGFMLPVEKIAQLSREVNPDVTVIVDGAQVAGLYPLDLNDGLIDYYIFSGHKSLYGPYGASGFVLCTEKRPQPIIFGGTGTQSEILEMPNSLPSAYEAGSQNVWAIAGLSAALDWLKEQGRENIVKHCQSLTEMLVESLQKIPGVRMYLPPASQRTSIVSFNLSGIAPQMLENALGTQGIAVRAGLHCAPWAHRWLGTLEGGGTVRVSAGFFNTEEDIKALTEFLASLK